jgi:hypothetical protein
VVREVLRDLQPENSPYNFAVLPVELLGTIYERFLGRVVHATDARVRIEEKPEVRKAGGVFYTPQYIVEYIVQHTLGELLVRLRVVQGLGLPLPPAREGVALLVLERLRVGEPEKERLVAAVRVAVAQTLGVGLGQAEALAAGERM